jgi:ATP-dependent RNA helicase RhlB
MASAVPAHAEAPAGDGQAPRKRRRRRGGRRTDGGEGTQAQGNAQNAGRAPRQADPDKRGGGRHSPPPAPHGEAGGSLLSRIGRGLRSLVKRAPRSQH